MKTDSLILFLHVVSAFGILVSFGLEWMNLDRLQRSCTAEETRASMKGFGVLPWIAGPSYLIVLISGIYLWQSSWRGSAWTVIALISLILIAMIGAALTGPRLMTMSKLFSGEKVRDPVVQQFGTMRVLWVSLQVRILMVLEITFLMTVKPGVSGSLIALAIAILLGLAVNPSIVSYYQSHDACAMSLRWNEPEMPA
jgi:hypothetical protein